ncbi:MAG: hypothetical protein RL213_214 [Bacteroidota bacterium]|jgi:hypothetical protein
MKKSFQCLRNTFAILAFLITGSVFAQTNQYLDFDGIDDFVSIPNGSAAIAGSSQMTITGWFYDNQLSYGQGMMGYRATGGGFYLIQLNNGQIECRMLNSAGTLFSYVTPNLTVVPQVWQHFAWVYNGSNVSLYRNGVLIGGIAASGSITATNIPFTIGKSPLSGFNFLYSGRIDEVSVWNKALTVTEIQDMMANELTGTEVGLKMYYKFNQGVPGGNNTSITALTTEVNSPTYDGVFYNFALNGATSNFNGTLNTSFQAISFPQISTQLTTTSSVTLGGTASSGLPVSYAVESGPATVSGNIVTITGAGTVCIRASQLGNVQYDSATSVVNCFDVVDPALNLPIIEARNPLPGADVYMPSLGTLQVAAKVSIDYPTLFNVQSVSFVIDGTPVPVTDHANGHFTAWWTPSSYGPHQIQLVSTSNYGAVNTVNVNVNVVQNTTDLNNQVVFSGVWLNTDSITAMRDGILPSFVGAFDTITAILTVSCPPGGCGPWDRVASIDAQGHDGRWFEIIRYITPYGVPCSHRINLTDYMSILQGKVRFRANCATLDNGFQYELKFDFKAGSPPHKYSSVTQVWKAIYPFGDYANLQPVPAFSYTYPAGAVASKLKLVSTGHGWGSLNTSNAAEFYNATHNVWVNGASTFAQQNWLVCNPNPDGCSPQNGTWTYARAGWCPGAIAPYFDYDMSSFVAAPNVNLEYKFFASYVDQCHPNNPNCVTGVTCSDCNDGFNPQLDVNCNLITFYDTAAALDVAELDYIGFVLFPNPTSGLFTLSSGGRSDRDYTVTVTDLMGKEVMRFAWNGERRSIDMKESPKGVYIIRTSNGKTSAFKKLVVQ